MLDLINDSAARDLIEEKLLSQFWCAKLVSYPKLSAAALRVLVSFSSTYPCESAFFTLVHNQIVETNWTLKRHAASNMLNTTVNCETCS